MKVALLIVLGGLICVVILVVLAVKWFLKQGGFGG